MAAVWNLIRHRYLGVSATVGMLLLLPIIVIATQRPQNISGIAEGATTIIFSPASIEESPLNIDRNKSFYLNVLLDPGENVISQISLDINYDPTILKLSPKDAVEVNKTIFPDVVKEPTYTNGRIEMTLSVGSDLTNAISNRTRAVTVKFTPLNTTSTKTTSITFGENTAATTVQLNNLEEGNVLSTTAPAYIKIN